MFTYLFCSTKRNIWYFELWQRSNQEKHHQMSMLLT